MFQDPLHNVDLYMGPVQVELARWTVSSSQHLRHFFSLQILSPLQKLAAKNIACARCLDFGDSDVSTALSLSSNVPYPIPLDGVFEDWAIVRMCRC